MIKEIHTAFSGKTECKAIQFGNNIYLPSTNVGFPSIRQRHVSVISVTQKFKFVHNGDVS